MTRLKFSLLLIYMTHEYIVVRDLFRFFVYQGSRSLYSRGVTVSSV